MADIPGLLTSITLTLAGIAGIIKLWPSVSSNIAATVASNRANRDMLQQLQTMYQEERRARVEAEAEARRLSSEWAKMQSKYDVLIYQLEETRKEFAEAKEANQRLTEEVGRLTALLRQKG